MTSHTLRALGALTLVLSIGCADGVEPTAAPTTARLAAGTGTNPLECPVDQTLSASGSIDALGGTVAVGGHSVTLPMGAVLLPRTITLTVPAGNYMAIDLKVDGAEHFQFEAPVSVTIDYSRCTRNNIQKTPLTAWYWDAGTATLLERMNATDDRSASRVHFETDHFSGYVVAN